MKFISSDHLLLIGCGIIAISSIVLINPFVSFFGISYIFAFLLGFIPLAIALAVVMILVNDKIWYKELTEYSFYRFKEVYEHYQKEVIKGKKTLRRFIDDYYTEHQLITYPIDSRGNPNTSEYQKKIQILNQIIDLLNNRIDLVNRYFYQDSFRYNDYLTLKNEYDQTDAIQKSISNTKSHNIDDEIIASELKKFVGECYENGTMGLGDRNFGYFLKHRHPALSTAKQYIEAWKQYINKYEPRDNCKYINDPSYWKNTDEIDATLRALERIENFYLKLMHEDSPIIKNIQNDKRELESLRKEQQIQKN